MSLMFNQIGVIHEALNGCKILKIYYKGLLRNVNIMSYHKKRVELNLLTFLQKYNLAASITNWPRKRKKYLKIDLFWPLVCDHFAIQ